MIKKALLVICILLAAVVVQGQQQQDWPRIAGDDAADRRQHAGLPPLEAHPSGMGLLYHIFSEDSANRVM